MERQESGVVALTLFSFGFKHGVPIDATYLFDVRFLPNPYWNERLRPLSGLEPQIAGFVVDSEAGSRFFELLEPLVSFITEQIKAGGGGEARVGVGCTGGRHRSVAVVEALGGLLRERPGLDVSVFHRDVNREAP